MTLSRRSITFSASGPSVFRNVTRDGDGSPVIALNEGEVASVTLDFAPYLASGETVSAFTVSPLGATASSSIASGSKSATVTISSPQAFGSVSFSMTTSSGTVYKDTINIRRKEDGARPGSYLYG